MSKKIELRKFQKEGLKFFEEKKRAILAFRMGLGKTLTSLVAAQRFKRVLVVTPASLKYNYAEEIKKWYNDNEYSLCVGSRDQRLKIINEYFKSNRRYLIINYEMLINSEYDELINFVWDAVCFDEVHKLSNHESGISKFSKKLQTEYILGLTGTPIYTKCQGLYSQLNLLDKDMFDNYYTFLYNYCELKQSRYSSRPIPTGKAINKEELISRLKNYIFVVDKKDIEGLPSKIYKDIYIELPSPIRKLYNDVMNGLRIDYDKDKYKNGMPKIVGLKYLCLDPGLIGSGISSIKTEILIDTLEQLEGQTIIFTYSKSYCKLLAKTLENCKCFHGDMTTRDKNTTIEEFKSGKFNVLVGTVQSAGTGLNLKNASNIIFTDKGYKCGEIEQAEDRANRLDSVNSCTIISLICKDTIEEDISNLIKDRAEDIESIINNKYLKNI